MISKKYTNLKSHNNKILIHKLNFNNKNLLNLNPFTSWVPDNYISKLPLKVIILKTTFQKPKLPSKTPNPISCDDTLPHSI